MADIDPKEFAVGTIFPYPEAFKEDTLTRWFSQSEFEVHGLDLGEISMGPQGIQIGGPFAEKGNLEVLYNPDSNIDGFAKSSFITIKSVRGADSDAVIDEVREFWKNYEELDISKDFALLEVTYPGQIRIDRSSHDFSNYFDKPDLDALGENFDASVEGAAARFKSEVSPKEPGYYTFVLDTEQSRNPSVWSFKFQYRVDSLDEIDAEELSETITAFVDRAKEE